MADEVKISALPAVTVPLSTDYFPVVQGGVTKKETAAQFIAANVSGTYLPLAGGALVGNVSNTFRYLFAPTAVVSTMSQTGILATITAMSSNLAGAYVVPDTGSPFTVLSYQGTTTVPTNVSQTITAGTPCTLYYFPNGTPIDAQNLAVGLIGLFQNTRYLTVGGSSLSYFGTPANMRVLGLTSASVGTAPSTSANVTGSQSGATLTGVGTSFDSTYVGCMVRYATGQTSWITAVASTTSATVTPSQAIGSCAIDIPGRTNGGGGATSFDAHGNFGTDSSYVTTLNFRSGGTIVNPNGTFSLPATSGTLALTQGLPLSVITGTSQSMSVNNSYISNNGSLVTFTLPSTAAVGDTLQIGGLGVGGWKIAQNASQLIYIGNQVTTTGTGGSLASTNQYDTITQIRCIVANTTWTCFGVQGNITVV